MARNTRRNRKEPEEKEDQPPPQEEETAEQTQSNVSTQPPVNNEEEKEEEEVDEEQEAEELNGLWDAHDRIHKLEQTMGNLNSASQQQSENLQAILMRLEAMERRMEEGGPSVREAPPARLWTGADLAKNKSTIKK